MKISGKSIFAIILALLLAGGAIGFSIKISNQHKTAEKNVYIALKHLEQGNQELAVSYLDKVEDKGTERISFARDMAEALRQKGLGNEFLCDVKLELIEKNYKLNDDQIFVVNYLKNGDMETGGSFETLLDKVVVCMKIPEKRKEVYDAQFHIEWDALSYGSLSDSAREEYSKICGEEATIDLALSAALSAGNYKTAFSEVAQLILLKPNQENRLLLADVLARANYAGQEISLPAFCSAMQIEDTSAVAEVISPAELAKEEELEIDLRELNMKLEVATEEEQQQKLERDIAKTEAEIQKIVDKEQYALLRRAMNSIWNIHTVEAELIKAKLYFAMDEKDKAMKLVNRLSSSEMQKLFADDSALQGLQTLTQLSADGGESLTDYSAQLVNRMLSQTSRDSVVVVDLQGRGSDRSLTKDFASNLLGQYKYASNMIYISSVDDSEYPTIHVRVNGREDLLNDIMKKKEMEVKDTHFAVNYTTKADVKVEASLCFVVDISGSMDGSPIDDARSALKQFAQTAAEGLEVSLCAFDTSATSLLLPTKDHTLLTEAAGELYACGGTDITCGVRCGIETLQQASGSRYMILMTDGESSFDDSVLEEALASGITIFTVGFGYAQQDLLQHIAEGTGGTFTMAENSGDLGIVYQSIGSVVGNQIELTYTITENPEETERYFFLRCNRFSASDRMVYRMGDAKTVQMSDQFYPTLDMMVDWTEYADYLTRKAADPELQYELRPLVNRPNMVESIEIAGEKYSVEYDDWNGGIILRIGELKNIAGEGLYSVIYHLKDGSDFVSDTGMLIYDSARENYMQYGVKAKVGKNYVCCDRLFTLTDGTKVGYGVSFYDDKLGENDKMILHLSTQNLCVFDKIGNGPAYEVPADVENWGKEMEARVNGILYVCGDDAQQQPHGHEAISAAGRMTLAISNNQFETNLRQ